MSDLIGRLRDIQSKKYSRDWSQWVKTQTGEAADRIEAQDKRIAELEAEIKQQRQVNVDYVHLVKSAQERMGEAQDELVKCKAQLAEASKDAGRYRLIRDRNSPLESHANEAELSAYHRVGEVRELKWGEELDAAIDAAMGSAT